ncbi:MAG TPA: ribonuclease III [Mesotoga sp.]|nr:ribonuclease III [Mesotoga sp.]
MMNQEEEKKVIEFCSINSISADRELIFKALCHSSFANELAQNTSRILESNERMEFLGDAVLEFSLATLLYRNFALSEGEMSKIRAMVGSEKVLSEVARELRIGEYLFLGKGERQTGGADRESILADAFEALLAAIYLSYGIETALNFVRERLYRYVNKALEGALVLDYKTSLQEFTQASFGSRPSYTTIQEDGPPQDKLFKVEVVVENRLLGVGEGRTKKAAEQSAARKALEALLKEEIDRENSP